MLPRLTAPPCHQPRVVAVGASPRWPPRPACPPARAHAHSPAAHPTRSTRQVWVRASSEDKEATNPLAPLASTSASSAASASASSPDASSSPTSSSAPLPGVKIDLGLPRRSRRVSFTCNKCDTRTDRMVNPRAWDSGMVFVQCGDAACGAWHKIADAAGLVEEIRFDNEDAPVVQRAAAGLVVEWEGEGEPHALVPRQGAQIVVVEVEGEVEEA